MIPSCISRERQRCFRFDAKAICKGFGTGTNLGSDSRYNFTTVIVSKRNHFRTPIQN